MYTILRRFLKTFFFYVHDDVVISLEDKFMMNGLLHITLKQISHSVSDFKSKQCIMKKVLKILYIMLQQGFFKAATNITPFKFKIA
jgi:hypothetical protein